MCSFPVWAGVLVFLLSNAEKMERRKTCVSEVCSAGIWLVLVGVLGGLAERAKTPEFFFFSV